MVSEILATSLAMAAIVRTITAIVSALHAIVRAMHAILRAVVEMARAMRALAPAMPAMRAIVNAMPHCNVHPFRECLPPRPRRRVSDYFAASDSTFSRFIKGFRR